MADLFLSSQDDIDFYEEFTIYTPFGSAMTIPEAVFYDHFEDLADE